MNSLIIANVEITTDSNGRYNLNALHRASGLDLNKAPSQWLRNANTQELIQEITDMQICTSPISAVKGGSHQGTFAHELLVVSYAGWISPAFQLKVNQAFIDSRKPKEIQLPNFNNPAESARAWADQFEKNSELQKEVEQKSAQIQSLESMFIEGMTVAQFCKQLNGVNTQAVNKYLAQRNWLYSDGRGWRVKSNVRDKYLTEKASHTFIDSSGIEVIKYKQELLKSGASRLHKMYMNGELPMKSDWDQSYDHSKFLFTKEITK